MKRIKIFAAIVVTFLAVNALTVNTAKAQVGIHVGLNFGTPYYHHVYAPAYGYYGPRYYHPVPAYGYYGPRYYHPAPAVVYRHPYYRGYYRPYRRW